MPYAINIYADYSSFCQQVSARFGDLPSKIITGSATYDPPSVASGAATPITTVTATGAVLGQAALGYFSLDLQGLQINAWVSATDTVSVNFLNLTGGTLNLGGGTLSVAVTVP